MFNHRSYLDAFLLNFKIGVLPNNSVARVEKVMTRPSYRIAGIHKLTGEENRSKHNLFVDVVDVNGNRLNEKLEWGWEGQRSNEKVAPLSLDKPLNEPAGNFVIWGNQKLWVRVLGKPSDTVVNVHTGLPDENPWNTWGHHSYYVVWVWDEGQISIPTPQPPVPPTPPTPVEDYERGFRDGVEAIKKRILIFLENEGA